MLRPVCGYADRTERQCLLSGISTVGTKVLHSNHTKEEIISYVTANLGEGCFSQLQTQGRCVDGTVLVSKKGRQTIKVKKHPALEPSGFRRTTG